MHINNNIQAIAGAYQVNSTGSLKRKAAPEEKSVAKDEVQLSSEAQSFSSMLQKLKGMDDVRQDKVDFYTKAIENGEYDVPAANIASKMLTNRY